MMKSSDKDAPSSKSSKYHDSEIRKELALILASERFINAPRMRDLLSYLVEESLQGHGDRIKAFTIAQEIFGRDEKFDQQRDTIVRVEAGRLRRRLEAFYASTSQIRAVRISIPKGGYTPKYHPGKKSASKTKVMGLAASLLLIAISITSWYFTAGELNEKDKQPPVDAVISESTGPLIAILPLSSVDSSATESRLAAGLVESLITSLAKLSGMSVMAHASVIELEKQSITVQDLRGSFGVTHLMRGNLQIQDELVRLNVQLIDTGTLQTIWAGRLEGQIQNTWDLQDQLAIQVAEAIAVEIQPDENAKFLQKHSDNAEALAYYRQALLLLIPPNDMTRILTARNFLKRANDLDPNFAGSYAGEGFSHAITVLFLNADNPGYELEVAIKLARKAIQMDPDFGMGYASLAFAFALDGQIEEGLENARLAVLLSPGDAFVQFIHGMNLVLSRRTAEAFEPLMKAIQLDPAESRTPYLNVLGIAHFTNKDYSDTIDILNKNRQRGGPRGPHMDIFSAAALANLGRETEARHQVAELNLTYPNFPYEAWLEKWIGPGEHLDTTIEKLRFLGLTQP